MLDQNITRVRRGAGRGPQLGVWPLDRALKFLVGLVLLALSAPPFFSYPLFSFWLLPLAGIYLFSLLAFSRLWLVLLPILTVIMDFSPWTGRFIYNEFDLLFIVTLASGFLYNRYRFKVFTPTPAMLVLLFYLLIVALAYPAWSLFILPPEASWQNPYYTSGYAYKVVKGMIWGIALVPMWGYLLAKDKQRAVNSLVLGMTLAALCLGLVILWERGTLGALLGWSAWYHVVSSLLDFTSSYRVTGWFSDMHTGGEVIDGLLLLLLPVTLYATAWGKPVYLRLLGVAGFLALAYVALVGFTRTTYVAFMLGILIYTLLMLWYRRVSGLPIAIPLKLLCLTFLAAIVAAVLAFRFAGSYGLASFSLMLLMAYVPVLLRLSGRVYVILAIMALLVIGFAINAHINSRWVESSFTAAAALAVFLVILLLTAHSFFRACTEISEFNRLVILGVLWMCPIFIAFAIGNYQMNDRMTQVSADLDTRKNHWNSVVQSSGDGLLPQLLGNGVGAFPARYIAVHPDRVAEVGSFIVISSERARVLRIGGGQDLMLGQRVAIEPYTDYTLSLRLRAQKAGNLKVALCERNLIYASNFEPNCAHGRIDFEHKEGTFQVAEIQLNSGKVGARSSIARWPTLLSLHFNRVGQVLEIESVELSAGGFNLLRSSSFNSGLDQWFQYNDFVHLPWHVKNLFLQVWFEAGWLGLALFLGLLVLLARATWGNHSVDSLAPVYLTGVVTVCVFGFFGSPLDSARVSWIFYFFLVAGLSKLRVRKLSSMQRRQKRNIAATG